MLLGKRHGVLATPSAGLQQFVAPPGGVAQPPIAAGVDDGGIF